MLVECDPSIKSIIINLDSENNAYIIEDLDETHLLIKENHLGELKARLDDVSSIYVVFLENSGPTNTT